MHLIQAAVLGVVQGLTEFLPVSSSAHLILARAVFGWEVLPDAHWNTLFDLSVHAGTFVALLVYFWSEVWRMVGALLASLRQGIAGVADRRLAWIILVATIPAALAGKYGERPIETYLRQAPILVASLLIAFGLILWLAEWRSRKARELDETGWLDGILIGCAQALALAPGVSRSGITMTVGLARGMKQATAARFSFLLSMPIIAGAALSAAHDVGGAEAALPQGGLAMFLVGFAAAAVSGYLCVRYFLRYLQRHSLAPFVIYRVVLGSVCLTLLALRAG